MNNDEKNEKRKKLCHLKHGDKYDYSKADFSKVKAKTTVICPIHGEFSIDFDHHYHHGVGCKLCSFPVYNTESFINKANEIHNRYYNYDKTNYINSHEKVIIMCPTHGDFHQTPNAHLRGEGCPSCNKTSKLEEIVETLLKKENIYFSKNKKEKWLITDKGGQSHLDFFIPDINLAIECQGKQHFGIGGWNKHYDFSDRKRIDEWKNKKCDEHNIELVYFTEKKFSNTEYLGKVFTNGEDLLNYAKYLLKNNRTK